MEKNRAPKGKKQERGVQKTVCFDRDKEKEREIGELDRDMRKHRLMRKKKRGFKTEPSAAIW